LDHEKFMGLVAKFEQTFGGRQGLRCAHAPGRVNLIGEHTDYNGGFVMPMAIDRQARVLFRPADRGPVRLWSENCGEWDEFDLDRIERNESPGSGWSNYLRGVAVMLQEAGHALRPIEGIVWGDVPIGAGLSSSAALEVAAARAFCAAADCRLDRRELALLCQRAENRFVGVNCGIMDQFVSIHAERQHALLLDCRSLEHRQLPLDTSAVRVVVCNTMVHHELGSSAYNERRSRCEEAARLLNEAAGGGIRQLRDASGEVLARHGHVLDRVTLKRARHVVSENERTLAAAEALTAADYEGFGRLMNESHESLRKDYEVSCEELDLMVRLARRRAGVLGARMVGAGFGGCTVNLVRAERADHVAQGVREAYRRETGIEPEAYQFVAVAGSAVERC
jgi:galactokinase